MSRTAHLRYYMQTLLSNPKDASCFPPALAIGNKLLYTLALVLII